ncbi:type IV pilus assembly protein PilE [Elusimicrobium simillimum]|uniref:type IV pilin protein n=1 Tax=Elusimicrobium simillimum TaxID=3143438 RepID=UPI003C6EC8AF
MFNKKGFTLIELLVVVLIIGILSAVALPQYTKTVEKSRASEAILNLKAITDSANRYYMMKNKYTGIVLGSTTDTEGKGNLDIEPPVAGANSKYDYFHVSPAAANFVIYGCRRSGTDAVLNLTDATTKALYCLQFNSASGQLTNRYCVEDKDNYCNTIKLD